MGKFRKLGRNYSQRLCMLRSRFLTRTNACILWLCVALPLISLDLSPRQDDGVAAGEARAHRDYRCQGTFFRGVSSSKGVWWAGGFVFQEW